ncbi:MULTISPECIES: helix-turn-helix domain-containing protein [unclassified Actinotalea]|uniref:helix-turn-helix domain-containing protein n=1 Tax=unclassified Actinotalea TaxID=2638618 RepID=UPI0015F5F708|nr:MULTISPECIES: helix-turn-helix domain-containing protein [unclassified Actinotalea]
MASTSPLRLVSTSTAPSRRRIREAEQPIINITLQSDERRVFSIPEAAAVLGIGRSKLYEFVAAGEIRTIHIGRLCKVPVDAIDEFLASRPSTPSAPSTP